MTEEIRKHPLNPPGRYYVDCDTCVHHLCCVELAPNNFKMGESLTAYVFKQPSTQDEEAQCQRRTFSAKHIFNGLKTIFGVSDAL